jgi:GTP-binding protein HflX
MSRELRSTRTPRERLLVCGVRFPGEPEEDLGEARALVAAADGEVVGEGLIQHRRDPDPSTLFGRGKVHEVLELIEQHAPAAVVVDNDLTPAQVRNLEKAWGKRVIDRSELILDIFARRARTRQARLQVELAQTEYLFPRLRRMWTHLERMEGAIGTRGPGETQLETDQRLLRKRIQDLREELSVIAARKQREVRSRGEQFTIGLVGYTNAGKSTLMNQLTGADVFVADMPFATLDTRTRQWRLPDGRVVLLSDTVGFIQRLPHHLVASFHATLEETLQADLLLHVVDASHPDATRQMQAVRSVLAEVSTNLAQEILVFNKIDRVADPVTLQLLVEDERVDVVYLSARTGEGVDRLVRAVLRRVDERTALVAVHLPPSEGKALARMRSSGGIVEELLHDDGTLDLRVRMTESALGNLQRELGERIALQVVEAPRLRSQASPPADGGSLMEDGRSGR